MKRRSFLGLLASVPLAAVLPNGDYVIHGTAAVPLPSGAKSLVGLEFWTLNDQHDTANLVEVLRDDGSTLMQFPVSARAKVCWSAGPGQEIRALDEHRVIFRATHPISLRARWHGAEGPFVIDEHGRKVMCAVDH